jgi:hypothetical protein
MSWSLLGPLREFGVIAGTLYGIDRILASSSPHTRLYVYDLMVQPITDKPLAAARLPKRLEVREIKLGDPEIGSMPVRPDVMQARLAQDVTCLGAFKNGGLIGYMWFCRRAYDEDEVRCTYVLGDERRSVFDFDFYIFPQYRMGLAFVGLWNGANQYLRSRGIHYTFSRLTHFNIASRRAHQHLGWRVVGRALFLKAWRLEFMLSSVSPYVHISMTDRRRVRLTLQPDVLTR